MDLRIVFMGTPDFAVPTLRSLLDAGYPVVGVVTATDKRGGRGKKQLLQSAVKRFAVERGLPVLQPKNLKDPAFLQALRDLRPNLQVVVAFRMLPESVWSLPEHGTFNLHASLLPKYRGAAPINWAIMRGERETGLTTFFINADIDTGDILRQVRLPIHPDDTAGDLHDRMKLLGADLVLDTVRDIEAGRAQPQPQPDAQASSAPKIFHKTCRIDFDRPVDQVVNFIRGLSPYPAAWTKLDGREVKILSAQPDLGSTADYAPGDLLSDNKTFLKIACRDGWIQVLDLKMQGKRRMGIVDFLNGYDTSQSTLA